MGEILWHRRETRRKTENTNIALPFGDCPAYSKPRCHQLQGYINEANKAAPEVFWQEGSGYRLTGPTGMKKIDPMEYNGATYRVFLYAKMYDKDSGVVYYRAFKQKRDGWEEVIRRAIEERARDPYAPGIRVPCDSCEEGY